MKSEQENARPARYVCERCHLILEPRQVFHRGTQLDPDEEVAAHEVTIRVDTGIRIRTELHRVRAFAERLTPGRRAADGGQRA